MTGGFSRSVVNFDAGAETPAAGALTAIGIAIVALALTPFLYFLPIATLAATIIVAVLSLVDLSVLQRTWSYSKADFTAVAATILVTFANARFLEDFIYDRVATESELKHVVLMCSAVNEIDSSALESLEAIVQRLGSSGVVLHLSEVKGPVMDRLKRMHFLDGLSGEVFLSQFMAATTLDPELLNRAKPGSRDVVLER